MRKLRGGGGRQKASVKILSYEKATFERIGLMCFSQHAQRAGLLKANNAELGFECVVQTALNGVLVVAAGG
jgi:hypothetical protein